MVSKQVEGVRIWAGVVVARVKSEVQTHCVGRALHLGKHLWWEALMQGVAWFLCLLPPMKLILSFFDSPSKWEPNNIRKRCPCRFELRAHSWSPPLTAPTSVFPPLISLFPPPSVFPLSPQPSILLSVSLTSLLSYLSPFPSPSPTPLHPPLPVDLLNFLVQQLDSCVNRCFHHWLQC